MWIRDRDTSLSPPILKRYTGSAWVAVGAQELKTSGISIGSNNVAITTENFLLQLLDPANNENVLMAVSYTHLDVYKRQVHRGEYRAVC